MREQCRTLKFDGSWVEGLRSDCGTGKVQKTLVLAIRWIHRGGEPCFSDLGTGWF